LRSSP